MKVLIFYMLLFSTFGGLLLSQNTVTGTVTDSNGELLPGASVIVQGTTRGTSTDFNGTFKITVSKGETLEVSYLGYETTTLIVGTKKVYTIVLKEGGDNQLDEIVVVGYGTQKKVNLTGSVATVTFKDEVNQPVTNSGQLLYGRFSGVQLTQSSGNPGADGSSIVIRGIGTFGSSTPLVVIDNIQYDNLSAFNNLAPSDIESVTVLKDASASAIYGARGANGVILVTTKKGKENKFEISYNQYYGFQKTTVVPDFLDAVDYSTLINEKFRNQDGVGYTPRYDTAQLEAIRTGSLPDQFSNTNWANEVFRIAPIQNHNLSFTGGNDKTTFRLSLGFLDQDAIVRSKFNSKRYNFSLNINSKLNDWFTLSSVTNTFWKRQVGPTGGQNAFSGDNGIIYSFQRTAPTIPVYYSNGDYGVVDGAYQGTNFSYQTSNPLRRGYLGNYENDRINISQRIGFTFKLTEDLTFETSGSANVIISNTSDFSPTQSQNDWAGNPVIISTLNSLVNSSSLNYRFLNENILRYSKTLNEDHTFGVLLGHSASSYRGDGFRASLNGFPTDNLEELSAGGVVDPAVSGGASTESYQSFFGRVNYNYKGKYLAEFNLRRDGSGKFGPGGFRYGNFPSASAAWRISEEDFFSDIEFISNLKLRGSWGISGNDRIGNYIFEQSYNPGLDYVLGDDSTVVGVAVTSLANPLIKWEETTQYDIGLDVSMFNNQLEITADYFNRKSNDILYRNFPVPATLGVTNLAAQNAASMVNEGLELGINYRGRVGEIKYAAGANFTKFLNNEVIGLGDGGEETIGSSTIIRIGEPFRAYYGYKAIGIFQDLNEIVNSPRQFGNTNTGPGDLKYADINKDGVVDADDRTVIGSPHASLLVNFNGSLDYKGIDFNFMFQGVSGVDRLLMGNGNLPINDNRSNVLSYWINRWTPENPGNSLPRVGGQNNAEVSSFYIQDVSYLRLKNIEIGYTLPKEITEKLNISKFRFFIGGQNLLTFTGLEHFDPERANGSQSNRGVPLYKTFTTGVNIKF
ncbi:TonB-dependent receptor [Polaribacter pectinis]|uniref:TonB-dependent receptor n=1 Tax=Polaribacter pectinis TaxID=2738844 RepID=A0A7G9L6Q4_9FLAO|nr:TonB-dependent receptor [Polaribacter pectinis]QNM84303.1 TonB-dependent receptor [Polaribacter pectinis]